MPWTCELRYEVHMNHTFSGPYLCTNWLHAAKSFLRSWHSSSQEIHIPLWNLKVHYCVHNSPPLVSILSQMNPVLGPVSYFITCCLLQFGVVSLWPKTQAGGPPLFGCPRLLFQCIRSHLYPKPEDAPCRGNRNPVNMVVFAWARGARAHTHTHVYMCVCVCVCVYVYI
jgi:hypothetical protein